jgi:hypothetical protein
MNTEYTVLHFIDDRLKVDPTYWYRHENWSNLKVKGLERTLITLVPFFLY